MSYYESDRKIITEKVNEKISVKINFEGDEKILEKTCLLQDDFELEIATLLFKGLTEITGYIPRWGLLTGDTLFCRTCGRVDFEGGEPEKMLESLKRLKNLEGDYLIYPGHNRATTLDEERIKNRYLKRDLDKWYW